MRLPVRASNANEKFFAFIPTPPLISSQDRLMRRYDHTAINNTVLCKPCACSRTQDLGTINESRGSALAARLDGVVLQSSFKHPLSVYVRDNGIVEMVVEADDVHNDLLRPDPVVELAQFDVGGGLFWVHVGIEAFLRFFHQDPEVLAYLSQLFFAVDGSVVGHDRLDVNCIDLVDGFLPIGDVRVLGKRHDVEES